MFDATDPPMIALMNEQQANSVFFLSLLLFSSWAWFMFRLTQKRRKLKSGREIKRLQVKLGWIWTSGLAGVCWQWLSRPTNALISPTALSGWRQRRATWLDRERVCMCVRLWARWNSNKQLCFSEGSDSLIRLAKTVVINVCWFCTIFRWLQHLVIMELNFLNSHNSLYSILLRHRRKQNKRKTTVLDLKVDHLFCLFMEFVCKFCSVRRYTSMHHLSSCKRLYIDSSSMEYHHNTLINQVHHLNTLHRVSLSSW